MSEYAIKVRREGEKTFAFLSNGGSLNRLKIHAIRFQERETAQLLLDESAPSNPGTEWRVVPL